MTTKEMERAIEFLLQSHAKSEAQASQQIESLAKTHEELAGFVRSNLQALNEVSWDLRETVRALTISQARTDERLGDLESGRGQGGFAQKFRWANKMLSLH